MVSKITSNKNYNRHYIKNSDKITKKIIAEIKLNRLKKLKKTLEEEK